MAIEESITNIRAAESEFVRDENKFVVPESRIAGFLTSFSSLVERFSLVLERHNTPVTRTAYYYLGDVNSLPLGLSVRYREYADATLDQLPLGEGSSGSIELKVTYTKTDRKSLKAKLKIPTQYSSELKIDDLIDYVHRLKFKRNDHREVLIQWLTRLKEQNKIHTFRPLFATEYKRQRYGTPGDPKKEKNVISLDTKLRFYAVGETDLDGKAVPIGGFDGIICELKEEQDNVPLRWELYRRLVAFSGERFYGKKAGALNKLKQYRSANAPKIYSEVPGFEFETKINLNVERGSGNHVLALLYQHFDESDGEYVITPGYRFFNTQTSINEYGHPEEDLGLEKKVILGIGSIKVDTKILLETGDVLIRREEKGKRFEYDRRAVLEALEGKVAGKILRIRRDFYVMSQATRRVYKISVDMNRVLPAVTGKEFTQLEIEYTGVRNKFEQPPPFEMVKETIKKEIGQLRVDIIGQLEEIGIGFDSSGGRKVDILER